MQRCKDKRVVVGFVEGISLLLSRDDEKAIKCEAREIKGAVEKRRKKKNPARARKRVRRLNDKQRGRSEMCTAASCHAVLASVRQKGHSIRQLE